MSPAANRPAGSPHDGRRDGQPRFERFVVVDWSANATPKRGKDSIWIGVHAADGTRHEPLNVPTRIEAVDHLAALLRTPARTLVGVDFPLGYPAGFAAAAGLIRPGQAPWEAVCSHLGAAIVDGSRNANNRWDVAAALNERLGSLHFWGAPPRRSGPHLSCRKPLPASVAAATPPLEPFRHTEKRLRAGGRHPFSVWQLLGAGSVGSQALTGIAAVQRLRAHPALADRLQLWPFETGFTSGTADIVVAEVWPSMVDFSTQPHPVKDAQQVAALAEWFALRQRHGTLEGLFAPQLPVEAQAAVRTEEGWVLGVE